MAHQQARGASPEGWVLEVFGRKYLAASQALAESLAAQFKLSVDVRLMQDDLRYETRWSDYDI